MSPAANPRRGGETLHVQRNRRPFTACGLETYVLERIRQLEMGAAWVPCSKCFPPDLTSLRALRSEPRKGWGR